MGRRRTSGSARLSRNLAAGDDSAADGRGGRPRSRAPGFAGCPRRLQRLVLANNGWPRSGRSDPGQLPERPPIACALTALSRRRPQQAVRPLGDRKREGGETAAMSFTVTNTGDRRGARTRWSRRRQLAPRPQPVPDLVSSTLFERNEVSTFGDLVVTGRAPVRQRRARARWSSPAWPARPPGRPCAFLASRARSAWLWRRSRAFLAGRAWTA